MEPDWLGWVRALEAIAQTGLHYARDPYDRERYEQVRRIGSEMLAAGVGPVPDPGVEIPDGPSGYATPKVDVRGAAFRDGRVLLVREASDGLWTLPGGWADVNATPAENVRREVREESGFDVEVQRLVAVWDRTRQGHRPHLPYHVYKMFFLCTITDGEARTSVETTAVEFFPPDALPPLSRSRVNEAQIERLFFHARHPMSSVDFD